MQVQSNDFLPIDDNTLGEEYLDDAYFLEAEEVFHQLDNLDVPTEVKEPETLFTRLEAFEEDYPWSA